MAKIHGIRIDGHDWTGYIEPSDLTLDQLQELGEVDSQEVVTVGGEFSVMWEDDNVDIIVETCIAYNDKTFIDLWWPQVNVDDIADSIRDLDDGEWSLDRMEDEADRNYGDL